jgi:hypothetical protein
MIIVRKGFIVFTQDYLTVNEDHDTWRGIAMVVAGLILIAIDLPFA